jgi:hypothetical protein
VQVKIHMEMVHVPVQNVLLRRPRFGLSGLSPSVRIPEVVSEVVIDGQACD